MRSTGPPKCRHCGAPDCDCAEGDADVVAQLRSATTVRELRDVAMRIAGFDGAACHRETFAIREMAYPDGIECECVAGVDGLCSDADKCYLGHHNEGDRCITGGPRPIEGGPDE